MNTTPNDRINSDPPQGTGYAPIIRRTFGMITKLKYKLGETRS